MNRTDGTRPCPSCGGPMHHGEREETISYAGYTLTYPQPGWHCDLCNDGILEGADNDVHDAALHELMALADRRPAVLRSARYAILRCETAPDHLTAKTA